MVYPRGLQYGELVSCKKMARGGNGRGHLLVKLFPKHAFKTPVQFSIQTYPRLTSTTSNGRTAAAPAHNGLYARVILIYKEKP